VDPELADPLGGPLRRGRRGPAGASGPKMIQPPGRCSADRCEKRMIPTFVPAPTPSVTTASSGISRERRSPACPPGGGHRGRASPSTRAGNRYLQVRASSFSPAVPPACHKQRSRAVCSGQSRSLRGGRWAGRTSLTWDGGGGRNCMACKGSGVQIPSAPPGTTHRRHSRSGSLARELPESHR
jgi:hypothetical protein